MPSSSAGDVSTVIQVNDSDEISPLLSASEINNADSSRQNSPQKINIFSVSYTRKRSLNKDSLVETIKVENGDEVDVMSQILNWIWNGSKYSGLLCVATSSFIYWFMELLTLSFSAQTIPLFQTVFTRCTMILLLSFLWLRKTGQPLMLPTNARNLLLLRSLTGIISMLSFIYSFQNLSLPVALTLNLATPIMASIGAKIFLQEKLALTHIGGVACSFLGLMFIFTPMAMLRGNSDEVGGMSSINKSHPIFGILAGIVSSVLGGLSYCLIREGAKASDQPVYTVLSFGMLAAPVSFIFSLTVQKLVLPTAFTFFLMILLGVLAFFAEMSLARGLQVEKVGKATNILYIKVVLSQLWSMAFLGMTASFSKVIGCLIILLSISSTVYFGPEKETE